ncbi:MAG: hypothetical protein ABL860_02020 [Candidatus Nitrotoga sp.]
MRRLVAEVTKREGARLQWASRFSRTRKYRVVVVAKITTAALCLVMLSRLRIGANNALLLRVAQRAIMPT